jgi:hypothetical protein
MRVLEWWRSLPLNAISLRNARLTKFKTGFRYLSYGTVMVTVIASEAKQSIGERSEGWIASSLRSSQ